MKSVFRNILVENKINITNSGVTRNLAWGEFGNFALKRSRKYIILL